MRKKTNLKSLVVRGLFLLGFGCATAAGQVIYVDDDANPGGDGQTWGTAYKYLQDALAVSVAEDEIWVAARCAYRPSKDTECQALPGRASVCLVAPVQSLQGS